MASDKEQPIVLVVGGPNGAGKSTASTALVHDTVGIDRYINADAIARGLSPFEPELSAVAAGRVMIDHIEHLAKNRESFALETTLSGVRLAQRLMRLQQAGYKLHLVYLWLPTIDLAINRVRRRVSLGGHDINDDVVRRRFVRSLRNLTEVYLPIVESWRVYDNAEADARMIAKGGGGTETIMDSAKWQSILNHKEYGDTR